MRFLSLSQLLNLLLGFLVLSPQTSQLLILVEYLADVILCFHLNHLLLSKHLVTLL